MALKKAGQRLAVLDLGTNTFHLLIAEQTTPTDFKELFRQRIFVKLGENGLDTIGEAPFQRGIEAVLFFRKLLVDYQVDRLMAFGTAALRTASNGPLFVKEVQEKSGIKIQLIDGDQEAKYIYLGVIQAVSFDECPKLIMDVGGGSVEFIIADQSGIRWAKSFPIGLSVLYNNFHHCNPISTQEIERMHQFLDEKLQPLFVQLDHYPTRQLVGAAGTFDVLEQSESIKNKYPPTTPIPVQQLRPIFSKIIRSTLEERLQMANLPTSRADMIVVAFSLMDYIIQRAHIQELIVSPAAMKEGIMREMLG